MGRKLMQSVLDSSKCSLHFGNSKVMELELQQEVNSGQGQEIQVFFLELIPY